MFNPVGTRVMRAFRELFECPEYIWGGGSLDSIVGRVVKGPALVILVLCECIWNAPVVLLALPAFDDGSCLSSPQYQVVYLPV